MNKKKKVPRGNYSPGDRVVCIDASETNSDIPRLRYGGVYKVIEVSVHGRPRLWGVNEEGELELSFYNPNRFLRHIPQKERERINQENKRKKEEGIAKRKKK